MPIPRTPNIRAAIESYLLRQGGGARTEEVIKQLEHDFNITQADLDEKEPNGQPKWPHVVHSAVKIMRLQRPPVLEPVAVSGRGIWQLKQAVSAGPSPVPPPTAPPTMPQPIPPLPVALHEQMQKKLEELGRVLAKFSQREYQAKPFIYDVVWKATGQLPPSHVFEVQDKGNLESALVKLKHASDIWPCQLFLVVTGEKDLQKAKELLAEHFAGAFHEIADKTIILSPEDIDTLHQIFTRYKDIIIKWK